MDQYKHFSHIHGLILHQVPQGSEIICSGCNFPGTGSVYVCWQCRFFLHEHCFNASRSMNHPSHPSHPLNLFPYPTYASNSFYCNSCNLVGTGFSYSCSHCEFDLHVHCTYLHTTNILEPPLSLPKETPGFDPQEYAYMPQTASTNIHEPSPYYQNLSHSGPNEMPNSDPQHVYRPQIDPIPNETKSFSPQEHDMLQTYTIPNETTSFAPQPHVYMLHTADPIPNETKHLSPHQHAYMPQIDPTPNYEPPSFTPQHVYTPQSATLNDPNLNYPPKNDTVPSFVTPPKGYPTSEAFLSNTGTNPTKTRGTKHFSHSHPLYLSEVAKEDYITCSGCEQAISGSSYSCKNSECNFYLHKTCFELRQEIRHESHPNHPLTLLSSPPYEEYSEFTCKACLEIGTAFTYHCSACKFDLHVACASLPETVKRKDHEHALVLLYTSPITEQMREEQPDISLGCDVCKRGVEEGCWVYNCKLCNYGTHLSCVNSENISEEVALADAIFNAQASMQRLQIQVQMSQQSAQFAISCAQSLSNLAG